MTKLRATGFALLDAEANVLAEGPIGEWVEVSRTGIAETIQVDLSDGSLLVKREAPHDGWSGYAVKGNEINCCWPPRPSQ